MKRIAIFTEGQGELIFTRHILIQLIGYEQLSFECFELNSDRLRPVDYSYRAPNALIHYQIVNVGTDERVLSSIIERYKKLTSQGFEVVGLRDMYSEKYKKKTTKVDPTINDYFIDVINKQIGNLDGADNLHFFFAIMELEAWLLGMYQIFERMDASLTPENIKRELGFDIRTIDPEKSFFRPAMQLKRMLALANIRYDKHKNEMENIVSKITLEDMEHLIASNRCNSFALFFGELKREFNEAQR